MNEWYFNVELKTLAPSTVLHVLTLGMGPMEHNRIYFGADINMQFRCHAWLFFMVTGALETTQKQAICWMNFDVVNVPTKDNNNFLEISLPLLTSGRTGRHSQPCKWRWTACPARFSWGSLSREASIWERSGAPNRTPVIILIRALKTRRCILLWGWGGGLERILSCIRLLPVLYFSPSWATDNEKGHLLCRLSLASGYNAFFFLKKCYSKAMKDKNACPWSSGVAVGGLEIQGFGRSVTAHKPFPLPLLCKGYKDRTASCHVLCICATVPGALCRPQLF